MNTFVRFFAFLFSVLFASQFAFAITNGELDGDNHPAVVLILMDVDGVPSYRCSGTLIAPTFVLTAGHCTGEPGEFSGMRVFTESEVDYADYAIEAKRWATHPDYTSEAFFLHDVGMIELEEPVILDEYGQLPDNDILDLISKRRGRQDVTFTAVGYGLQQINPVFVQAEKIRMVARPKLDAINAPGMTGDFSMLLSNNHSTGGTCFGDSGGPNFIGTGMVVGGVTSFGLNGTCGGTGGVFRVDRGNVLDFINGFKAE